MKKVRIKATIGNQNGRRLLTGFIKAKDLIAIHELDEWKPGKSIEEQGCQRKPMRSHYRNIGKRLNENDAIMPTSIVMSVIVDSEGKSDRVEFGKTMYDDVVFLNFIKGVRITDGMHRIYGSDYSITELGNHDLENFEFPFVMILANDRIDEIMAFYEINSKSKNVATDLALQLLNEINKNTERKLNKTEKWKLLALNVAMAINKNEKSVWFNNISIGQTKKNEVASSVSFVTSLKPFLDIPFIKEIEKESKNQEEAAKEIADWLHIYWEGIKLAIPEAFPKKRVDKHSWVIQKTPGIFSWHILSPQILNDYIIEKIKDSEDIEISSEDIADFLREYGLAGVQDPESFWLASNKNDGIIGGVASKYNSQKAFKELSEIIICDIEEQYKKKNRKRVKIKN